MAVRWAGKGVWTGLFEALARALPINETNRKYHWPLGRRPDGHPGLSGLRL